VTPGAHKKGDKIEFRIDGSQGIVEKVIVDGNPETEAYKTLYIIRKDDGSEVKASLGQIRKPSK
jgi:hypothetical protein